MRRRHRSVGLPVLGAASIAALGTALTGCFTTAADFGSDAETFIEDNEELRDALFADPEASFTSATCEDPDNQDEGTRFPCTATDSNGDVWEFEIVITGSSEYEVNVARRPAGS